MKFCKQIPIIVLLLLSGQAFASQFAELDKPPEGAHEGQMLLSGTISIGLPIGEMIDQEKSFVNGNTYMLNNGTTKELLVNHLTFSYGVSFEYMPLNHIGAKSILRSRSVVQRTQFGSTYRNWSKRLYKEYSLVLGSAFHLTERKSWDVSFTPLLGYSFGQYNATPIAATLLETYKGEKRERSTHALIYGGELSIIAYFSGGFFFSLGLEYSICGLSWDSKFNLSQNNNNFMTDKTSGSIHTATIAMYAGYAFSN